MSQLIKEAFQELKTLNEDTFSFDKEGMLDLSKFLTIDNQVPTLDIIDPQAANEDELAPDYLGKVALQCCVCNQLIYADPSELEVDEGTQRVNVGQECPHCYNIGGYKVVGQINPYVDTEETKVTVDGDDVEIKEREIVTEELGDGANEIFTRQWLIDNQDDYGFDYETIDEYFGEDGWTAIVDLDNDDGAFEVLNGDKSLGLFELVAERLYPYSESLNEDTIKQDGKWVNKGKEGTHGTFRTKKAADAQRKAMFAQGYRESLNEKTIDEPFEVEEDDIIHFDEETGDLVLSDRGTGDLDIDSYITLRFKDENEDINDQKFKIIRRTSDGYYQLEWLGTKTEELNEDFTKATVETGESVLSMESDDSGKVTVTSEPRKIEESGEEMLAPVSAEVEAEIETPTEENTEGEEQEEIEGEEGTQVDMDIEEIEEEGFDELGESYLRKEYDNVKSFKTTRGVIDNDRLKLEGIITFNSGKKAKTSFIFESNSISKKGKLKFLGENLQFAKKKNAFTLIGSVKDNKLMVESLTYNYRAQDPKSGARKNLYGTIKRSK